MIPDSYSFRNTAFPILLILLGALLFAPVTAGANRPIQTGVTTIDAEAVGEPRLGYQRVREAGANWTRVILFWRDIAPETMPVNWNPQSPGEPAYDWSASDALIRSAAEAGVRVVASIYSAPGWAERCKTDESFSYPGTCNPDPDMFADFAEAAAKRYSGEFEDLPRVQYWKAWNEPNLRLYFAPQFDGKNRKVSPRLYGTLLNRFSARVKQVDPENQVVTGGLAPYEKPGGIAPMDFMRRLLCVKGGRTPRPDRSCALRPRFDVWAHNPYTTGRPTRRAIRPDDVALGDLPEMKKVLDAASRAGNISSARSRIPFWVTEMSWDSNGPDPGGVPMKRLGTWISEAIFRSWKAGVSNFFWLSLRDWNVAQQATAGPLTIESGLYFRAPTLADDRPKPILRAFRFPFVSFRNGNGIRVWGRTPDSGPGVISLSYRGRSSWREFGKVRAGSNGVFTKQIKTRLGSNRSGSVRAELVTGRSAPETSAPFPLRLDRDKPQPPFGS